MCLIISKYNTGRTAKTDITVYKVLNKTAKAIHRNYQYSLGKLNKTDIKNNGIGQAADHIACDYYDKKFNSEGWAFILLKNSHLNTKALGSGFHACETYERAKLYLEDSIHLFPIVGIYECTIPAGSKYYKDGSGLIVSSQLIVNKII